MLLGGGWFQAPAAQPPILTPSTWDIVAGVLLTVLGNIIISWGQMSPKIAAIKKGNLSPTNLLQPPPSHNSATTSGFFFVALGNVLHILGLWFAPSSLLAPANAVGLFANQAFVVLCTDVKLTLPVSFAFGGIATGIIICSVAAEGAMARTSSVAEFHRLMLSSWSDPAYLFFIFCLMATTGALIAAIHRLQQKRLHTRFQIFLVKPHWQTRKMMQHPQSNTIKAVLRQERNPIMEKLAERDRQTSQLLSACVACVAGMVGSQTVCQVKECEAVFKEVLQNPSFLYKSFLPLTAVLLLAAEGFGQYYLLLPAYAEGDPITMSALYYTAWTVLGALGGFIKFKEHQGLTFNQRIAFAIGLALCTISILLICYGSLYTLVRQLLEFEIDQNDAVQSYLPPVERDGRSMEKSPDVANQLRTKLMLDMTIPFVPRMLGISGVWYQRDTGPVAQTDAALNPPRTHFIEMTDTAPYRGYTLLPNRSSL